MKISEFDYYLPREFIAQYPIKPRDHSKLMLVNRRTQKVSHHFFYEIEKFLQRGDVLVLNNSKVIPARLIGRRVPSGGAVECLLLARLDAEDLALSSQAAQAAEAAARTQRDLAAADLKRFQDLLAQGFVSQAEIDRRQATLRSAEAALQQAQAQRAVQGNQAGYARLQADAAGVVVAVLAEPGQVVAAGTPVLRVARDGPRDVVFAVPEDRVALVRPGQGASVRLWSAGEGGPALKATVREVAASADGDACANSPAADAAHRDRRADPDRGVDHHTNPAPDRPGMGWQRRPDLRGPGRH